MEDVTVSHMRPFGHRAPLPAFPEINYTRRPCGQMVLRTDTNELKGVGHTGARLDHCLSTKGWSLTSTKEMFRFVRSTHHSCNLLLFTVTVENAPMHANPQQKQCVQRNGDKEGVEAKQGEQVSRWGARGRSVGSSSVARDWRLAGWLAS